MPLNKLENFLKNVEGRILYVSPADLDSTDSILNQGNSQTKPFKTLQRALIEAARFSYNVGRNNDTVEKTTILLMPGEHEVDNRPGFSIREVDNADNAFQLKNSAGGDESNPSIELGLGSNFDITQEDNILYKFNSIHGGVIVPRGTSIVGLDLRKTKIRPKYVPNPTDDNVPYSALFRITGACYFWQFSIFDGNDFGTVYTDNTNFDILNRSLPTFSHHKLTCFEYADGVNDVQDTGLTDLDMYYYKLSRAYNSASNRNIEEKFLQDGTGTGLEGFAKQRPEWEIVGAFATDPSRITKIQSGTLPGVPTNRVTVTTQGPHNLSVGTPIKIKGVGASNYNISTKVSSTDPNLDNVFTYTLPDFPKELETEPAVDGALVIIETDTVSGASPYIFNISLRSVWGMNGMHADGNKASGFRSMVVAQFTGVSLQKDDRAFVKYSKSGRQYLSLGNETVKGTKLSTQSSSTNTAQIYHLDSEAIYRKDWQTTHVKITNDAILQIVSVFAIGYAKHFEARSGGDASITNSNSNFGQLALVSDGFRKDAFKKDDNAFISHIITPKAITTAEEDVEWVQIDVGVTTSVGITTHLYLFGYTSEDVKPPSLTQGFRVGARNGDKLYVDINDVIYESDILMDNDSNSSARQSTTISSLKGDTGVFTTPENHEFLTGEKVIIIAEDGDLPENILEHRVYFIIKGVTNKQFKLALSKSDADNDIALKGTFAPNGTSNLKVISRVTDKESGDIGHPVQYDKSTTPNQWYITTNNSNVAGGIFKGINDNLASFTTDPKKTEISFFKRVADTRSLDDKIFKTRVSIPRQAQNGKNLQNGFVLQESSQTSIRTDGDLNFTRDLTASDFAYERNPRFISSCTFNSGTATVVTERPHNLQTNDLVKIEALKSSNNTSGTFGKGYNVEANVTVTNNMTFTYAPSLTVSANPTNNFSIDKTDSSVTASSLPKFTRKDLKSNIYFYRSEVVSEYDEGVDDGVYHGFALTANLAVPDEFTDNKYGQTVVDLYPQLDRDNTNDSPLSAKSFALRSPLGKVVTNDLQRSITKEATDELLVKFGSAIKVSGVSGSTITLERNHNICGLAHGELGGNNTGFTPGTYENVKIFEGSSGPWNGTLAKVTVNGGGDINSFEITNPGSGFVAGMFGYWDISHIGGGSANANNARIGSASNVALTDANLTSKKDNLVVQFTGSTTTPDVYFRTTSTPEPNQIVVARTSGDTVVTTDQYAFIVGNALVVTGVSDSEITTSTPHGLKKGNRFQFNDDSNNNLGTFIVSSVLSTTEFTFDKGNATITSTGYVLKHGLSANDADTGKGGENLSVRGVPLYGLEQANLNSAISADDTTINISLFNGQEGGKVRFPQGSYIQIDDEILRIASLSSDVLSSLKVIRGVLGTQASTHNINSLVQKLSPIPLELHRSSILRASGHTFEYLGYGPGNYSTALPQVQVRTLTEREEFLSQAQETAAGSVVYTGMNDKGDFYIGNQRKSALTGEETTFDNPVPTVAGEDPSRLSVVFDEVTIKERLVVEGGKSNNILSQFDGPVTFTSDVRHKGDVKIKSDTASESKTSGALTVDGGVGVGENLNVDENIKTNTLDVTGISTFTGAIDANGNLDVDGQTDLDILNVAETATFTGNIDADGNLDVDGQTDLDVLNVAETATFSSNITANGNIVGDNTNISGINNVSASTFTGNLTGNVTGNISGNAGGNAATATALQTAINIGGVSFDGTSNINLPGVNVTGDQDTSGNAASASKVNIYGANATSNTEEGSTLYQVALTSLQNGLQKIYTTPALYFSNVQESGTNKELLVSGDIIAFAADSSDDKLKTNRSPISDALNKVNSINGFTYNWNDKAKELLDFSSTELQIGVSAQEVQKVAPEVIKSRKVPNSDEEILTVKYEKLVPLLIEAIKELSDKVDDLEQKLSDK